MKAKDDLIEDNTTGTKKDFKYSFTAKSEEEAQKIFELACKKLKDINNWHNHAKQVSAIFKLTDQKGVEVTRDPIVGDHIKIDIPGPGTKAGHGFDWVKIECIHEEKNDHSKIFLIKVRPSENPLNVKSGTAHFLTDSATSTFLVDLNRKKVFSEIHGRNESPNFETEKIVDKVRNAGVAAGAIVGIANIQWNALAKGLLS